MSGKKPILTMAQGIPRIHAVPNEIPPIGKGDKTGQYQQFFGEGYPEVADIHSTSITIDPKVLKQHEAGEYLEDIQVDQTSANRFAYSQHPGVKPSLSMGSRVLHLPNLTTDRPANYKMTCTKSVHKVVFLFCSVALAIIIACIIFVEMKKMQMDEREY